MIANWYANNGIIANNANGSKYRELKTAVKIVIILIISVAVVTGLVLFGKMGAESEDKNVATKNMEKTFLTTGDGIKIAGEYFDSASAKGVLLLHMMPATKESWGDLPLKLQERGFKVLAIDLRGHGESQGGPDGYKNFSDAEHQKSIQDVKEAADFLKERGVEPENLVLVGASIGANLALEYLGEHPDAGQGILLSAGLDYRGVKTGQYAEKLVSGQRVFLVSSEDDNGNVADNRALFDAVSADVDKKLLIYKNAGHGTNMFGKEEPDLEREILEWLRFLPDKGE